MNADVYLARVIQKYQPKDHLPYLGELNQLKSLLMGWAGQWHVGVFDSGSMAKGTAISIASDVDYLVSLSSGCNDMNGGLKGIYESLYKQLSTSYSNVRKQNVSIRINLYGLEVDVTPAMKLGVLTSNHWIYVSKKDTRQQTNIRKHITDISTSGRLNEIKVMKIWREINKLDFPSIYLEYLITKRILILRPQGATGNNCFHILQELAKESGNPLFARIEDPANSSNILSDLLSVEEKNRIISTARKAVQQSYWEQIVW